MRIVVLVKQVPDTWGERVLDPVTGRVDRERSEPVADEIGDRALEVALRAREAGIAQEVIALTMGPDRARTVLRGALAMGADSAVHLVDDALAGADLSRTAAALAAALRRIGFDLVLTGNESTDGRGGVLPAMLAEHLGIPHLTSLTDLVIEESGARGTRATEYGEQQVRSGLPVVVSVTERVAEPRFATFRGVLQAKKKPLTPLSLAELGIEAGPVPSRVSSAARREARGAGRIVDATPETAAELVEFLAERQLLPR